MTTQIYCTRADIEATWSIAAVIRSTDDDHDGTLSTTESGYIDLAIERGANRMNACLEMRYTLSQLAANTWCRDCNAAIATYLLATRRGNPAPDHIQEDYESFLDDLEEIRIGRLKVPQAQDSQETIPTVTNFDTDLRATRNKVRRIETTSTGQPPPAGRKSHPIEGG